MNECLEQGNKHGKVHKYQVVLSVGQNTETGVIGSDLVTTLDGYSEKVTHKPRCE